MCHHLLTHINPLSTSAFHRNITTGKQEYTWALSIVSSYAFTLGDDQFQGLVPMWDMLNHVTGMVNVRLNHDGSKGLLQMIATQDIPAGMWGRGRTGMCGGLHVW